MTRLPACNGILQLTEPVCTFLPESIKSKTVDLTNAIIGVEFENEMKTSERPFTGKFGRFSSVRNWDYHEENSLRYYGFEFVSRPTSIPVFKEHTDALFENLSFQLASREPWYKAGDPLPFTNSTRTSVHVHFDVTRYSTIQLINFVSLYWIMEPFLQHFCGAHRQGNLFCLRLKDSSYMKIMLSDILSNHKSLFRSTLLTENFRYGSVNFNSLRKFGTVEFRLMRGVSEAASAAIWVDALEAIRQKALTFNSTNELRDFFLNKTEAGTFPKIVLGTILFNKIKSFFPSKLNLATEIRSGYSSVAPILQTNTNFSSTMLESIKKKELAERETKERQRLADMDTLKHMIITSPDFLKCLENTECPTETLWNQICGKNVHPLVERGLRRHKKTSKDFLRAFHPEHYYELFGDDTSAPPPVYATNPAPSIPDYATVQLINMAPGTISYIQPDTFTWNQHPAPMDDTLDAQTLNTYITIYGINNTVTQNKFHKAYRQFYHVPGLHVSHIPHATLHPLLPDQYAFDHNSLRWIDKNLITPLEEPLVDDDIIDDTPDDDDSSGWVEHILTPEDDGF